MTNFLRHHHRSRLGVFLLALAVTAVPAMAIDKAHVRKGEAAAARAIDFLRKAQGSNGSWAPQVGPAVTAMIVSGMLGHPGIDREDPTVAKALTYILSRQKDDGGIYDRVLANYNTSICLMALGPIGEDPDIKPVVKKAHDFLRGLQWSPDRKDDEGEIVDKDHPFFGGQGYGKHGRPDLSNTIMMIAGLHDSGLNCNDPAYTRAMSFISQLQGVKSNTKLADQIEPDGGFIYSSSVNKDNVGVPESKVKEKFIDSLGRSRLRTYGSMTYGGFMSFIYSKLERDDPRVQAALGWIRENYTLEENPRMGKQGYFYYLHLFSRGLQAW
ncbi:MAG: hypothetical protein OER86_03395, partial [Phycisphaerae bacterium]|nr:hypothetical protein [Phycisphaerae bacterium]